MKYIKSKKSLFTFIASLLLIINYLGLTVPLAQATESDAPTISVVTSFYPMYEFTQAVTGDQADISSLVTTGNDPHNYEPSVADILAVSNADVFVYSSEQMEYWVETLLTNIDNQDLVVVRTADAFANYNHNHSTSKNDIQLIGLSDHYHTGDILTLTADLTEDSPHDHWHWFYQNENTNEWEVIEGQATNQLEYTVPEASINIKAILYDDDHNVYVESEPVVITVDNHEHDHEHDQDDEHNHGQEHEDEHNHETGHVTLKGLAHHYHTGDILTLQAETDAEVASWEWRIRTNHDDWEILNEQTGDTLEYELAEADVEVQAVALDAEGHHLAESEVVLAQIDNHDELDPHIWLDPISAQQQVAVIRDALIQVDPEGEAEYTANAETFINELQILHEEYDAAFQDAENRSFIVQHEAFGHLAERYNLEQIAIGGLSTEVEPSPARIQEITNLVNETNAPVIYYQQGASSAIAQTIASETGADIAVLHDLETISAELQADNLGYLEAMRENLEALKISIH